MIEVKRNPELQKIVPFGVPNRFQLLSLLIDSAFITAHVPTIHRTVSKSVLKSGVVCAAPINDDAEKRLLGNLSFLEKIGMATLKVNMERPAAASQLEDGLHQPQLACSCTVHCKAAFGLQLQRAFLTVARARRALAGREAENARHDLRRQAALLDRHAAQAGRLSIPSCRRL